MVEAVIMHYLREYLFYIIASVPILYFISTPMVLLIKSNIYRFMPRYKVIMQGEVVVAEEYLVVIQDDKMDNYVHRYYYDYFYFRKKSDLSKFHIGQKVTFRRSFPNYSDNRLIAVDVKPLVENDYIDCDGYIETINQVEKGKSFVDSFGSVCLYVNGFPKSFVYGFSGISEHSENEIKDVKYGNKCTAKLEKSTGRVFDLKIYKDMHDIIKEKETNEYGSGSERRKIH